MRRTRFISLFFFVLSLAFLGVREFRQALLSPWGGPRDRRLSAGKVMKLGVQADEANDAKSLAFAALQLPLDYDAEIHKFADRAVELDASLTWIYHHLALRYFTELNRTEVAADIQAWSTRVLAWDPQNAAAYLLRAEVIRRRAVGSWPQGRGTQPYYLDGLERQSEWRVEMETAFSKPRYDMYLLRRFDLDRRVLREQGWDNPATAIASAQAWPTPNRLNIRDYANLVEQRLGAKAEAGGRTNEALAQYWKVAHFGERLRLDGRTTIEWLTGNDLRSTSYDRMIPLLKKTGKVPEAETVEFTLAQLQQETDAITGSAPLGRSTNRTWAALLLNVFGALVVIFLLASVACFLYVLPRGGYAAAKRGRFWQTMLIGQNYMPLLLFVSCVGLFITYYPFAQNFGYYMTAEGPVNNFEPLFFNTLPSYTLPTTRGQLELQNPLRSYAPWALVGFLLLILVVYVTERWEERRSAHPRSSAR